MKVVRGAVSSIAVLAGSGMGAGPAGAAEAATCAEKYYLCLNEATQTEGFWARSRAELACAGDWYVCVKNQAFGA